MYAREKALSIIHSAQNWLKKAISVRGIASSLPASSPGHSGGAAGEGRRACNFQFPCGSPSTELSDSSQSARRGNERKFKQTLKNTCQE